MPLKEELEANGNWLFVRRSWLPILLYPLAVAVLYFYLDISYEKITDISWSATCLFVSFLGLLVRAITIGFTPKGTSGRNTCAGQVAESLNQTGIYSIVRHPLYLGNYLMWLGLFMYLGVWWFVVICSLAYWLYYERIMLAEEEYLRRKYKDTYEAWASKTPAFLPNFSNQKAANLTFSFKNVLKREYNGLFATAISFVLFNILGHFFHDHTFSVDFFWQVVFVISLALFMFLRFLKKKTKVLDVEGR
jgi:protein-S-isoprenylcysteine O-methyltransferase Ste14